MSNLNNSDMKRRPSDPGEVLREYFLSDYELSVSPWRKYSWQGGAWRNPDLPLPLPWTADGPQH